MFSIAWQPKKKMYTFSTDAFPVCCVYRMMSVNVAVTVVVFDDDDVVIVVVVTVISAGNRKCHTTVINALVNDVLNFRTVVMCSCVWFFFDAL